MNKDKDVKAGQESLLLAFEFWICNEYNESVLPATPLLLKTLLDEGLLASEMLSEYWKKVLTTKETDAVQVVEAKEDLKEAEEELDVATEELKKGKKEDADAAQQAKWAAAEVQNARTGNQPTPDEVAREKAASVADTKARNDKLTKLKNVELFHKRQVSALNANEAATKNLAEKISQARPCQLMHQFGIAFFDPNAPVADSKVSAPASGYKADDAPKVDDKAPEADHSAT